MESTESNQKKPKHGAYITKDDIYQNYSKDHLILLVKKLYRQLDAEETYTKELEEEIQQIKKR